MEMRRNLSKWRFQSQQNQNIKGYQQTLLISFQKKSRIVFKSLAWHFKGMTYLCTVLYANLKTQQNENQFNQLNY